MIFKPTGTRQFERDGTVTYKVICPRCYQPAQVRQLDPFALQKWLQGGDITELFPHLSRTQRETLLSGLHDSCFELWFMEE